MGVIVVVFVVIEDMGIEGTGDSGSGTVEILPVAVEVEYFPFLHLFIVDDHGIGLSGVIDPDGSFGVFVPDTLSGIPLGHGEAQSIGSLPGIAAFCAEELDAGIRIVTGDLKIAVFGAEKHAGEGVLGKIHALDEVQMEYFFPAFDDLSFYFSVFDLNGVCPGAGLGDVVGVGVEVVAITGDLALETAENADLEIFH